MTTNGLQDKPNGVQIDRPRADLSGWIADHNPLPIARWHACASSVERPVDPFGTYADTYWLPVIGPSALCGLRRLLSWLGPCPDGFDVPLADFAGTLGLGHSTAKNAPVVRTLARLVQYRCATVTNGRFCVYPNLPTLTHAAVERLPGYLAARHRSDALLQRADV